MSIGEEIRRVMLEAMWERAQANEGDRDVAPSVGVMAKRVTELVEAHYAPDKVHSDEGAYSSDKAYSGNFIYLGANLEKRRIWVLEHEGDYSPGDTVIRISVSDHESIQVDVKPNCE